MILILVMETSRLDDHLLGSFSTRINNFSRTIVFRGRALLAQSLRAVSSRLSTSMQICHHLRPAAMANAVVPNTIYLLLKESASSFISEGGTQNIGVISVTATYASICTNSLVQPLPFIQQQLCESISFRGRALRCQLLDAIGHVFNLRAMWLGPNALPFARECEDIWGLPNSLQNSPWGNLSVSKHARVKYGNHVCKYQTRAWQKSDRYYARPVRGHDGV